MYQLTHINITIIIKEPKTVINPEKHNKNEITEGEIEAITNIQE